jgi:hypothetical protein
MAAVLANPTKLLSFAAKMLLWLLWGVVGAVLTPVVLVQLSLFIGGLCQSPLGLPLPTSPVGGGRGTGVDHAATEN